MGNPLLDHLTTVNTTRPRQGHDDVNTQTQSLHPFILTGLGASSGGGDDLIGETGGGGAATDESARRRSALAAAASRASMEF